MRIFIISLLSMAFSTVKAQNCVAINQANIASINTVINTLSANGGGCIEIESGDYYNVPSINMKSNIVLKIYGRLYRNYDIINIIGCKNVSIIGDRTGALIYRDSTLNPTAKGIQIKSSSNIYISGLTIKDFADKGILLRGPNTYNVEVRENTVTGALSESGVGIALSDDDGSVYFCNIVGNSTSNNRIGISVNKSKYINITGNYSYGNELHGIGLDGIVSYSGDGPQNCIVSNNQVYNNGGVCESGKTKSGIYLGNGAQKNLISNNIVKNNKCDGIFYYEDSTENSSYNNSFIGNQVISNHSNGIRIVNAKRVIISNNQVIQNGTGGLRLEDSTGDIISGNNFILNGSTPADNIYDNQLSNNVYSANITN
ncbi:MAG: right-handed parallel beta-helix repeat-containing protein [Flavobacteriia bacterium]|nr:right-handed parallel beta-helix repeat-containing protein [Flavobacteriia bacterium]